MCSRIASVGDGYSGSNLGDACQCATLNSGVERKFRSRNLHCDQRSKTGKNGCTYGGDHGHSTDYQTGTAEPAGSSSPGGRFMGGIRSIPLSTKG
jgi:hypothetical protein